ncbi:small ubiquitin-related modifier [Pancytospora epiphaga]|nr:small ubiquitin-related modifier [Pancytospora epiphaga]
MSESEESASSKGESQNERVKQPVINTTKIILSGGMNNRTVLLAKPSTMVGKLLAKYCEQRKISPKEYRLVYNGKMMNEEQVLGSYNVKDNDTIDVVAQQVGGAVAPHY